MRQVTSVEINVILGNDSSTGNVGSSDDGGNDYTQAQRAIERKGFYFKECNT